MANIKIEFSCDNAAFESFPEFEAARILRGLADKLEQHGMRSDVPQLIQLNDANGNKVGKVNIT
jgi:hypothetical protein